MRKICLIAILAIAALAASAETHVSIVAAPQLDAGFGVRAGADADFSIGTSNFSFVPGLYWSMRKKGYSVEQSSQKIFEATDNSHWLSVPLRFAYNVSKGSENCQTQLLFGPYVALGLGGTTTLKSLETGTVKVGSFDEKNGLYDRRFDVGFNAGVNFIIKRHFIVGAFGEVGFIPLCDFTHVSIRGAFATPAGINVGFGINLGYRF